MKKGKQLLSILLAVLMVISSLPLAVATGESEIVGDCGNNLIWTLDTKTGVLTISGEGPMWDYQTPWESYASSITSVVIENGVTSIGSYVFADFDGYYSNLTNVEIPDSVNTIGWSAFSGCSSLKSVLLGSGLKEIHDSAFSGCTSLESITIPNSVEAIWSYAFSGCTGLKSVLIGSGVKLIGELAFDGCTALTSIRIPGTADSMEWGAFYGCTSLESVVIEEGVKKIPDDAFYGCTSLTSVEIPDSVETIGYAAFSGCTSLASIIIPDSVVNLSPDAFEGTALLEDASNYDNGVLYLGSFLVKANTELEGNYTIRTGTKRILGNAFSGCDKLTGISIPESVTLVEAQAFSGCNALVQLEVALENTVYHSDGNCIIQTAEKALVAGCKMSIIPTDGSVTSVDDGAFAGCTELTEITIPNSVTSIDDGAFAFCTELTDITIPNSVTSIGQAAFYGCSGLTSVSLSDNLTSISPYLFNDCTGLTNIVIPNSVRSIGYYSFDGCTGLTSITIPNGVESMDTSAFSGCVNLERLTVDKENTVYHSSGNCIIETSSSTLVLGCIASVIPESGVTRIGNNAFANLPGLTSIVIPEGVTVIEGYAFYNCKDLTQVSLPSSLTRLGDSVFYNCTSLADVYYGGETEEQFKAIDGYWNWDNFNLRSAQLHLVHIHQPAEPVRENIVAVTDEANGSYDSVVYCSICGEEISRTREVLPLVVVASGTFGDSLNWSLANTGTLTISGTGNMGSLSNYNSMPWSDYKSSIKSVVIKDGVNNICGRAFYDCSSMTSIIIPDSVTAIGASAFWDCKGLTALQLPTGLTEISGYAFTGCEGLTSIEIPNGVTSIGEYTFQTCFGLTSIIIPNSVTSIGYQAFRTCRSLTEISIPNSVTSIGSNAFIYSGIYNDNNNWVDGVLYVDHCLVQTNASLPSEYEIKENTRLIADRAFYDRTGLISISIPNTVVTIGESAFTGCTGLTSIVIPDSVKKIGQYAFSSCSGLTNITIPDGVTSIGKSAFYSCTGLTSITVPDSVTDIGSDLFQSTSPDLVITCETNSSAMYRYAVANGLRVVVLNWVPITGSCGENVTWSLGQDGTLTISGSGAMNDYYTNYVYSPNSHYESNSPFNEYRGAIQSVVIEEGVTNVGSCAFYGFSNLATVSLPDSLLSIGSGAFSNTACEADESNWDGDVFYLDHFLVKANSDITGSYKILDGTRGIADAAFRYCHELTSVSITDGVEFIGQYAFYECGNLTAITVPGSVRFIGYQSFYRCSSLKNVVLSEGVETLGAQAFFSCNQLEFLALPASLTEIGDWAIEACSDEGCVVFCPSNLMPAFKDVMRWMNASNSYGGKFSVEVENWTDISGECGDNLTWVLTGDGTLTISGTGKMTDYLTWYTSSSDFRPPWYDYASLIKKLVIEDGVTGIGMYAFYDCINLSEVSISNDVVSIDMGAFNDTAYFKNDANWDNGVLYIGNVLVKAKNELSGSYTVRAGTKSVSYQAFYNCTALEEITFPEGMISIDSSAFEYCRALTRAVFPDSVTEIASSAFYKSDSPNLVIVCNTTSSYAYTYASQQGLPVETLTWEDITGTCGENLTWSLSQDGTLTISGTGEMENYESQSGYGGNNNMPTYRDYRSKIKKVVVEPGVTSIGSYAFNSISSVESVELPEGLTSIGSAAFSYCSGLTEITLPDGLISLGEYAFSHCTGITEIMLPEGLTELGYAAFSYCYGLSEVTIPGSVNIEMGVWGMPGDEYIFSNCTGLKRVVFEEGVSSVGEHMFSDCTGLESVVLPNSVQIIGEYAFSNCCALTDITIPETVSNIGGYAFFNCISIENVMLPSELTKLENGVFSNCESLTGIEFPATVTEIGDYAFNNCVAFSEITLPDGLLKLGSSTFANCTGLTEITLPAGLTAIGGRAFYGCSSIAQPSIPESVTDIGDNAFGETPYFNDASNWVDGVLLIDNCLIKAQETLSGSYEIPVGTRLIAGCAFEACSGLTEVVFPESVAVIGSGAFEDCSELENVQIPNSVISIGYWAFQNVKSIAYNGTAEGAPWGALELLHTEHAKGEAQKENEIPSTCTKEGSHDEVYYCVVCGEELEREHVVDPLKEHDWDFGQIIKENTCTEDGSKIVTCSSCGLQETHVLSAPGHWPDVPVKKNKVKPTPEQDGSYDLVTLCRNCGEELSRTTEQWAYVLLEGTQGDNITWKLTNDGTLTVSGTGAIEPLRKTDEQEQSGAETGDDETEEMYYTWTESFIEYVNSTFDSFDLDHMDAWSHMELVQMLEERQLSTVKSIVIEDGITSVGPYAFSSFAPKTISLAASVEWLDPGAFNATSAEEIIVENPELVFGAGILIPVFEQDEEPTNWAFGQRVIQVSKCRYLVAKYAQQRMLIEFAKVILDYLIGRELYGSVSKMFLEDADRNLRLLEPYPLDQSLFAMMYFLIYIQIYQFALFCDMVLKANIPAFNETFHCSANDVGDMIRELVRMINIMFNTNFKGSRIEDIISLTCKKSILAPVGLRMPDSNTIEFKWNEGLFAFIAEKDAELPQLNELAEKELEKLMQYPSLCPFGTSLLIQELSNQGTKAAPKTETSALKTGDWLTVYGYEGSTVQIAAQTSGVKFESIEKLNRPKTALTDASTGVTVNFVNEAYNGEVTLVVTEVPEQMPEEAKEFSRVMAYDITTQVNGEEAQPEEPVMVSIPLDEDYDPSGVAVYHITENGSEKVENITVEDDMVSFPAASFSTYVVVDEHSSTHIHQFVSSESGATTCGEAGEITYTCSCGESFVDTVDALKHYDENGDGNCDRCGEAYKEAAYIPGDINSDGAPSLKDAALLQQHLSGWDVSINYAAADTNQDNNVNLKDVAYLQQYLSGWDVDLDYMR